MQISNTAAVAATVSEAQSTASQLAQQINYSATVAGKTYAADVSLSAGEYVATVPQLAPPVTASGGSVLLAESNLSARINLVV